MRTMNSRLRIGAALIAFAGAAQSVDTKIDVAATGPATPPVIRASTNTPISYPGGPPPANVVGAFDAGDSTFNRPVSCTTLSGVGTAVPYDTITLTNTGASNATVNIRLGQVGSPSTACGTVIDPFMAMYNGSFSAAAPLTNCLLVNDDTAAAADRCPSLNGVVIPSGQVRVFVLTTFNNAAAFNYEVTFVGTTPVALQQFSVD